MRYLKKEWRSKTKLIEMKSLHFINNEDMILIMTCKFEKEIFEYLKNIPLKS